MRMPVGARAGLKRHDGTTGSRRPLHLEQAVDTDGAGKPAFRAFDGRLAAAADHFVPRLVENQLS